MNIFDIFKKKNKQEKVTVEDNHFQEVLDDFNKHDYLSKAAEAGHKANAAVKNKEFDKAWGFYHEQKLLYMQHADRSGFTMQQVFALDSQVHENLANILRIESKHDDALVSILYWIIANNDKPIKRHQQKLTAYFNRCKLGNTSIEDAMVFSTTNMASLDYSSIQLKVAEWRSLG